MKTPKSILNIVEFFYNLYLNPITSLALCSLKSIIFQYFLLFLNRYDISSPKSYVILLVSTWYFVVNYDWRARRNFTPLYSAVKYHLLPEEKNNMCKQLLKIITRRKHINELCLSSSVTSRLERTQLKGILLQNALLFLY